MRPPLLAVAALALAGACDNDMIRDGTRGSCSAGGAISGCPRGVETAEDACWRLVECGVYPVDAEDPDQRDWGTCMNRLEGMSADRQRLVIACIAASTCDELLAPGSPHPYDDPYCWRYGEQ